MKVVVLLGGTSAERDVSIATGSQVIKALRSRGHDVSAVDPAVGLLDPEEERQMLETGVAAEPPRESTLARMSHAPLLRLTTSGGLNGFDVIFMGLHGGSGEDGRLQAVLELADLPFTGSNHVSSALAMDKDLSKKVFREAGIPTADWAMAPCDLDEVARDFGFPLVAKANKQGSTVGLTIVKERAALEGAIAAAYEHDDEVLLERFIPGREITVGILGGKALAVGEIIPQLSDIFDYQSKYQNGGALEIFPADLPTETSVRIQELGLRVHQALKLRGYSRVDFRLTAEGDAYCLEANTLPGLTAASLLPKSADAVGIPFPELCERICLLAIERHEGGSR